MPVYGLQNRTDHSQFLKYIDEHFCDSKSQSITSHFPLSLGVQNISNLNYFEDTNGIEGVIATFPRYIKTQLGLIKASSIGCIGSHNKNQLALRSLVKEALRQAKGKVSDIAITWSTSVDQFQSLGFNPVGQSVTFTIESHPLLSKFAGHEFRISENKQLDPTALLKLHNHHSVSAVRNQLEIKSLLQKPDLKILSAWQNNKLMSYIAIENSRSDSTPLIAEWAGSVSSLLFLVQQLAKDHFSTFELQCPWHSYRLINQLEIIGFKKRVEPMALVKILNPERLICKLSKLSLSLDGPQITWVEVSQKEFALKIDQKSIPIENPQQLAELLFGKSTSTLSLQAQSLLPNNLLPLPFWIWGFDRT